MDEAVRRHHREMKLCGRRLDQQQIALANVRFDAHQPDRSNPPFDFPNIPAAQPIVARRLHPEREARQPDAIKPPRQVAPLRPKPHPDAPASAPGDVTSWTHGLRARIARQQVTPRQMRLAPEIVRISEAPPARRESLVAPFDKLHPYPRIDSERRRLAQHDRIAFG